MGRVGPGYLIASLVDTVSKSELWRIERSHREGLTMYALDKSRAWSTELQANSRWSPFWKVVKSK